MVALIVMPLIAMVILQYGSYFRARSHGEVFHSIADQLTSRVLDYGLCIAQFCVGFVMLAGAGANLNQHFGTPTWVGSTLMVVLVLVTGLMNVDRVTRVISAITPLMIVLLIAAGIFALTHPMSGFSEASAAAQSMVESPLATWWLATFNYLGLAMFSGISMAIVIGGSQWNPKVAGWGGFLGGLLFSGILILITVGLMLRVESVGTSALPTLQLFNDMHPYLGIVASVATYLMIFSTAIGIFYSLGRRVTVKYPDRYVASFITLTLVGFGFTFFDFAQLVSTVFPVLGWMGIIIILVLAMAWVLRGRNRIEAETRRRDKLHGLILRKLDPGQRFLAKHRESFAALAVKAHVLPKEYRELMRNEMTQEIASELDGDSATAFDAEGFSAKEEWESGALADLAEAAAQAHDEADAKGEGEAARSPEAHS